MLFNLLQAEIAEAAPVATQEMSYSLIDMATKGGWLMIVLLVLSVIAIYIFGKKVWVIGKANKIDKNFIDDIKDYVTEGKIQRNAQIRLVRDGIVIHEGVISSLRRFKDDVKEVATGYECGIGIENYNDIKPGDEIECFEMVEIER